MERRTTHTRGALIVNERNARMARDARHRLHALAFLALLCACGGGGARSGTDGGDQQHDTSGPLKIISLSSTVSTVTEMDTVTFIAIVTDQMGLDSIAGGTLTDDSGATYGGLGAGAQKGTYQIALTWAQINEVRTLQFDVPASSMRTFTAKFFDNAGNEASASQSIGFRCAMTGFGACNGTCTDLGNPASCGTCSNVCAIGTGCTEAGTCIPGTASACFVPGPTTCADYCTQQGKTCVSRCEDSSDDSAGVGLERDGTCGGESTVLDRCQTSFAGSGGAVCCCG
jgi:hypothetical protein